jgi:hypothetical protein
MAHSLAINGYTARGAADGVKKKTENWSNIWQWECVKTTMMAGIRMPYILANRNLNCLMTVTVTAGKRAWTRLAMLNLCLSYITERRIPGGSLSGARGVGKADN